MSPRRSALAAGLGLLLSLPACAAHAPAVHTGAPVAAVSVAWLPIENLSGRGEYGERMTRLVFSVLGRGGRFRVVEPGEVDAVMSQMRIRSAANMTRDQLEKLAGRLGVRWVIAGTLLECGTIHTPDGDVPTFSLALRLLDGRDGSVAWTGMRARSGEDRETVFGWGRVENLDRLADLTTSSLVDEIRIPQLPDSLETTESKP